MESRLSDSLGHRAVVGTADYIIPHVGSNKHALMLAGDRCCPRQGGTHEIGICSDSHISDLAGSILAHIGKDRTLLAVAVSVEGYHVIAILAIGGDSVVLVCHFLTYSGIREELHLLAVAEKHHAIEAVDGIARKVGRGIGPADGGAQLLRVRGHGCDLRRSRGSRE